MRLLVSFLILTTLGLVFSSFSSSAEKILTKIIVRVVSRDAKVIGTGVGGASVRIKDIETGAILAQGKQEGGTGDTNRIMVEPHRRGEVLYGTAGSALFEAGISLERPTQVEILVEAPLAYPQSIQKGTKTITLIPGKHILGEGVIIELNGLVVNVLSPDSHRPVRKGEEVTVRAEVKML